MKIVCDSCATKYSISDDKVRGKVFKIRCKKCSHIIVVRGTADAAAAPAAAATAEAGGWHLVVEGEQVGPLPEAEIRARLGRGEINGETYIWKEGLADWLKLGTVPEFADAASPGAQPTDVAGGAGDLFTDSAPLSRGGEAQVQVDEAMVASSSPAPSAARLGGGGGGGGLFSAIDAAAVSPARVGRGASADHDDGFGAPMAARGGGGDLFASHAAASSASGDDGRRAPAANHDGGRVENLTAQRHENSVLFSLANLQQLAMPSVAPKASAPVTNGNGSSEGSGLIDIRAMAATTMGGPSLSSGGGSGGLGDDLPTFGSFSAAAPVLLPIPTSSGPPKWMYAVIGGMVILVMAYKILTTKPVTEIVQVPVPAPAPPPTAVALAPKAAAPAAPAAPAIPDEKLPPREGAPGTEGAKVGADGAKHDKGAGHDKKPGKGGGKDKKGGAFADSGGKSAPAAAAPAPEPEKKGPAKGSLDDLLDNALSGKRSRRAAASDDDSPSPRKAAAPPAEAAGPLSKSAVVAGMNGIKPKINDCYNQFKVPGMAMVMVVIGKNGKVSSASVSGKFAGTPSGACVEKAVKSASFPPSEGLSTPYPFQLK
jgi:predicted Zn finger-like uncharacterized protein